LVSFFALVVFLVGGFFTVAAFLVVVGAFFVYAEGFLVVDAFSAGALVLLADDFLAGAALVFSVAFFVVVLFLAGCAFCIGLSDCRRSGGMTMTYLLGISRNLRPLRSELDLAREAFGENKDIFLSTAGECQVELM